MTPLWFGAGSETLFGFHHAPASGSHTGELRRMAIVLCNPFGYEAMRAHRAMRELAERLALGGFCVLRFDYHGTGNSAGDDRDPARVDAWKRSVSAAIECAKRISGCASVGLLGLRLGANLALLAAAERDDVAALALWGPCLRGGSFVREELAAHRLRANPLVRTARGGADEFETLGFSWTAETHADLLAIDVGALHTRPARAALVLTRETPRQEHAVAERLAQLGVVTACEPGAGYAELLAHTESPTATWTRVCAFFDECDALLPAQVGERCLPARAALARVRDARIPASRAGAVAVDEAGVFFGGERRLFGVLTQPAQREHAGGRGPVVLLVNGGRNHHVGTNRMHVTWARDFAQLGLTSLRFDFAGLGDSGHDASGACERLYSAAPVADVQAAIDYLEHDLGAREFVLVGLCSGAFVSFHAALADRRVHRVVLLNLLRFYDDDATRAQARRLRRFRSLRYYVRALGRAENWRKVRRNQADVAGIARHLAERMARRAYAETSARLARSVHAPPASRLARDFAELTARGVKLLLVFNGDDAALDDLHEQLGPLERELVRSGAIDLRVFDGTDHIFTPVWSQAALGQTLRAYLAER